MELKFYRCRTCNKIITMVNPVSNDTICCGQPMQEIVPNTTDAAIEKHVPVVEINGNELLVKVGSIPHPKEPKHYIEGICIQTSNGIQYRYLKPINEPQAHFQLCDNEKLINAFAYCNVHGLGKK